MCVCVSTYIERTCSRSCHQDTCGRRDLDYSNGARWSHHIEHLVGRSTPLTWRTASDKHNTAASTTRTQSYIYTRTVIRQQRVPAPSHRALISDFAVLSIPLDTSVQKAYILVRRMRIWWLWRVVMVLKIVFSGHHHLILTASWLLAYMLVHFNFETVLLLFKV